MTTYRSSEGSARTHYSSDQSKQCDCNFAAGGKCVDPSSPRCRLADKHDNEISNPKTDKAGNPTGAR